jgi:hypothetical protein
MDGQTQHTTEAHRTARRRLIRGAISAAAAAPIAASANPFLPRAVASNQRCVDNQLTTGNAFDGGTTASDGDNIVRVRVYQYTFVSGSNNYVRYVVRHQDLFAVKGAGVPNTPTTTGQVLLIERTDANDTTFVAGTPITNPGVTLVSPVRWTAVRFNSTGVVGVSASPPYLGTPPSGGSSMYKSCWTSFAGVTFPIAFP